MKAYISISYSKRKSADEVINAIIIALKKMNIAPFVFVDEYSFKPSEEKQMMEQAMKDIDSSDLLIAETSDKAIGIGIEAGYAKAKNKSVIYLRHQDAEHSTTLSGLSDVQIIYSNAENLVSELSTSLKNLF